ncbi:MAG TPA: hypothetical protein VKW04_22660 [Planctomycetota bacterium]|nr:hypothetical protein [Planctomycetota bacterium]
MNLSAGSLFLSLAIGTVGTGFFIYGKKQSRPPQLIGGILLALYPYFISNLWLMAGIAVAIVVGIWGAVRAGF